MYVCTVSTSQTFRHKTAQILNFFLKSIPESELVIKQMVYICGIKLVHFSFSFIITVNCCLAAQCRVQCFIIPQVLIGRHPVTTVLYWLPCHGDCEQLRVLSCTELMGGDKPTYCLSIFHILHDLGNLNVTVFTHHKDYDRHRNLQFVLKTVNRHWGGACGQQEI